MRLDVTDSEAVTKGINDAVAKYGRIDVLVNNAGEFFHRALGYRQRKCQVRMRPLATRTTR